MGAERVSIIIPFLNPPIPFFREALESVVDQTYKDWELLLVDDGSDAATLEFAREFQAAWGEKVRLIQHEHGAHRGLRESRKVGCAAASGDYVAFLDADDRWLNNKLEEQVRLLRAHPEVGMLYGNSLYWSSWRRSGAKDFCPRLGVPTGTIVQPPTLVKLFVEGRVAVPCPSSIISRRDAIQRSAAYEGAFDGLYEDQVFLARMCMTTRVLVMDECWDHYRLHDRSMTAIASVTGEREKRRQFLEWLVEYARESKDPPSDLVRALEVQLREVDRPLQRRVKRFVRKWMQRLTGGTIPKELMRS